MSGSRSRNGQAALEYLVTYGWGFVIILVVIGALAYFGLLSPSRYVPARCDFGAQLECSDYQIIANDGGTPGRVMLKFRNNFGDDITIRQIYLFNEESGSLVGGAVNIDKGNVSAAITAQPNDDSPLTKGDRVSIPAIITFRRSIGSVDHNVTGEIFGTVQ